MQGILSDFQHFYEAIHPAQENSRDVYAWFSDIPHPFLNLVLRFSSELYALPFLNDTRPMTLWVPPENRTDVLLASFALRGFKSLGIWPAMLWQVQPLASSGTADIRRENGATFYSILSQVYTVDEEFLKRYAQMLQPLACEHYVLYVNEQAVSVASLFIHEQMAEVFNEATLSHRREAHADMMQFLMKRAGELGLDRLVTLSSPEAQELYESLGFATVVPLEIFER